MVSRFRRNHRHIITNKRKDQTFLIARTIRVRSHFYGKGAREDIIPGPQKEGQTRSTLTVAKPQDHLQFQVSLTKDIDHNSSVNVPYVAGWLKQFVSVWQTITSDFFNWGCYHWPANRKVFANRSYWNNNTLWRRVYFKYIHSAKERWLISFDSWFEKSESVCTISSFQNGKP